MYAINAGAGECGKSTVLKQMQILHSNGFTEEEINEKKAIVYNNTVTSMCTILKAMDNILHIPLEDSEKEREKSIVLRVQEVGEESEPLTEELSKAIHFLDSCARVSEPGYRPSEQDILYSRVATTGVVEVKFKIKELDFRVFDVGGQRSERRKWIHCFDNVESIIFITAISEYDQVLFEDETTVGYECVKGRNEGLRFKKMKQGCHCRNRMIESMQLFNSICNSTWFLSTAMILFMNKKDLFMEKIQRVNITTAFPDYEGPTSNIQRDRYDHPKEPSEGRNDVKSLGVFACLLIPYVKPAQSLNDLAQLVIVTVLCCPFYFITIDNKLCPLFPSTTIIYNIANIEFY
uniref:G-protein alpha subunit n=1 Tax=Heterorhabditis bacteriophora TaxID=37862 RepID=A0A1I7XLK1_HETBA